MKVLIDGRLISDKQTGISRYSEELLNIYVSLYGKENIILLVDESIEKNFDDLAVIKTRYYPFRMIDFIRFHSVLKKIDFDIYHTMFYASSFFKIKNKIYITTVHDIMYKLVPNFFNKNRLLNALAVIYFDFIVKKSLNNSDYIISVSDATRQDIYDIYKKNSIIITEGINQLSTDDTTLQIDKKSLQKDSFLLYVGNNRPHKNVDFLKNCYLNSDTSKKLVIVGHDGKNIKFENKEIIYTGYINEYTLKYLYTNSKSFMFPSLYEGFGLPILEAINMDTIVLSSNQGSLKEFGEYNIYYFNPHEEKELIDLINSIENFAFDYEKKKILLNRYSWDFVKQQMEIFYKENIL